MTSQINGSDNFDSGMVIGAQGQQWQDFTSSRQLDQEYTNDTGSPIYVLFDGVKQGAAGIMDLIMTIDDFKAYRSRIDLANGVGGTITVPNGSTYKVETGSGIDTYTWREYR